MTALVPRYPSILHALVAQAERGSDGPEITLIPQPGKVETLRSDAALETARRGAAVLAQYGVGRGDRVLVCLPTGWQFVTTFFATQLLGASPTATAVPISLGGAAGFEDQLQDLVEYLRPAAIVTTAAVIEVFPNAGGSMLIDGDAFYAAVTADNAPMHPIRLPADDDLALIQCTSGSTGRPKGVMITHANLAANCEQFAHGVNWQPADTSVSWLPLYHDMGLIAGLLCPVFSGASAVLMPPSRFLRAPAEWLQYMSKFRGAVAAAPNFAYGYATARIRDEELEGVDLSSWRMVLCGAEPIQPATLQRFQQRFARWGMHAEAPLPGYGMAEATLAITMATRDEPLRYDTIDRQAAGDNKVVDVDPHTPDALQIVDCGAPAVGTELRIVDGDGTQLGDNQIGHIQFRGPSRTIGYFDLPEETAAAIAAPDWWKTGDVGYVRDGRVRITGRVKDLIIIRGVNHYPSDFEQATEAVPGVRLGAVIAVGYRPQDGDSEELHLIVETEFGDDQHDVLRRSIMAAVTKRTGVPAAAIHIVPKRSIPKTTSGKLQRAKARKLFVDGWSPSRV